MSYCPSNSSIRGDYTVEQIVAGGNSLTVNYACAEGVNINHVEFMPNSDLANVTGVYTLAVADEWGGFGVLHFEVS
jgi:hypothetical protein